MRVNWIRETVELPSWGRFFSEKQIFRSEKLNMHRREFIQSVLAGLAVISASPRNSEGADEFPDFDKSKPYGLMIVVFDENPFLAAETIIRSARQNLPSGTPFRVLTRNHLPTDEIPQPHSSIAWKYSPNLWEKIGTEGVFIA